MDADTTVGVAKRQAHHLPPTDVAQINHKMIGRFLHHDRTATEDILSLCCHLTIKQVEHVKPGIQLKHWQFLLWHMSEQSVNALSMRPHAHEHKQNSYNSFQT